METWSRPAGEPNFPGITSAAVDGRRQTLVGATAGTTSSCTIPVRQPLQKMIRGPSVSAAGLQLLGDARDQLHSDDDDLDPGTGNLDDALSLSELQSVYHLPSKEAARSLNVSLSRLKRSCRAHNVLRWPHRKLSSLSNLQDTIGNDKNMKLADKQRILQQITNEIAAVRANPDHTIDPRLDEIRQAKYKLKYYHKTKHIHASVSAAARKRRQSSGCSERSRSVSHSGAPTSGIDVSGGVPPQQLSVSLPNPEPLLPAAAAMTGRDVPFTTTVSGPPAFPASIYTTSNAVEGDAGAFTAGHMGGSVNGRLALGSPPGNGGGPARLSSNRGSISGGGFGIGGGCGGSMRDGLTLVKDSGGSTYSSSSEFMSRAASLTGPAAGAPPLPLPAGRLSEPNGGLGGTHAPSWCVLSMQPGPAPSLGGTDVVFNQQQSQQKQQQQHLSHMQHSQQQHRSLHHQLLHWEQQVQMAAVRRPSFGITDETSGAAHLLPGMMPWARQSVTSLEGGSTSMAMDGGGIGVVDCSGRMHHSISHNSLWMLPPPQQPSVPPPYMQSTSSPALAQAPSSPPASRGMGVGGGGDGGSAVAATLHGPNSAGSVSGGGGDAFPPCSAAPHHTAAAANVQLPPPSAAAGAFAAFATPAAVDMTESTRGCSSGGGSAAKPSVPYSHGVVNTSCPPPRCSSTGDPQPLATNSAAMQLPRQTSAPPPVYGAFIGGSGGARGGSGGGSSCPGGGAKVYGTTTETRCGLPEGANRGRFLSADGAQYQQPPGLPLQERQAGGTMAFHAAATAAATAASATRADVGGNASGSTTGAMLRFEARMGMSSGHGTCGPSWFAVEARVAAAPAPIAVPVSEPAGVYANAPSTRVAACPLSREGEMRHEQQQQRQPNERDLLQMYGHKQTYGHKHGHYHYHQQHLMEHARMQGPFSTVQPQPRMPSQMAPSLEHHMGAQYCQSCPTHYMQQQQQQHPNHPYYGGFSGGCGGATAMDSSSSPTHGMQEAGFGSAPCARYGDGRVASTAAAQRSLFGDASLSECAGSPANIAPATGASQSLRASGPPAPATAAFTTPAASNARIGMATAAAPGNGEGRMSSSSPVAMAASGSGGREDSSTGVGGGCGSGVDGGGGGAGGGDFLSSAGGSDGVGAAPTGSALNSSLGFVRPGATNTPPGRAVTTGVPARMPSPPTGSWALGQYPFRGFADAAGPECISRVESGGGNSADIAGSAWLGPRPGGPREALEGRLSVFHKQPLQQQQQNVQQQMPPLHSGGKLEPWSSFSAFSSFPFDSSSPVVASSGAVAAAALPARGIVTAVGGAGDVGCNNAAGSSEADMDSAQAAIGEAGSGNGPGGAILASLDWLLD